MKTEDLAKLVRSAVIEASNKDGWTFEHGIDGKSGKNLVDTIVSKLLADTVPDGRMESVSVPVTDGPEIIQPDDIGIVRLLTNRPLDAFCECPSCLPKP